MNLLPFLEAGATTEAGAGVGGMITMILGYVVIFGGFIYFAMIRPQKKQQKNQQAMLATVEPGDSVLTTGGFYGNVIDVMDEIVIVEFGNNKNCRIPMKKAAIVEVEKASEE